MERILIYIKNRFTFLWKIIEWFNGWIFYFFYNPHLEKVLSSVFDEYAVPPYSYRMLKVSDSDSLAKLISSQNSVDLKYFNPHRFDLKTLKRLFRNYAFIMMGVFDKDRLVGYFFLRCFVNMKCFVGRLIDQDYRGRNIGQAMNNIMYAIAWRMRFRCLSTISKNNIAVMRAHAKNSKMVVLKELRNDYLLVEFVQENKNQSLSYSFPIDTWSMLLKRVFDIMSAFFGLIVLIPLFLFIVLLIKLKTPGPVFFKQERIGRFGKTFTIYKFRTMIIDHGGGTVSLKGEKRITPLGEILRKYKIDELPELWNVLKGDLSLVGPRPDVFGYINRLTGDERFILEHWPGITSPASLRYSDEEELLASIPDPIKYYDEVVWPDKVRLNIDYCRSRSFIGDVKIILRTILRKKKLESKAGYSAHSCKH